MVWHQCTKQNFHQVQLMTPCFQWDSKKNNLIQLQRYQKDTAEEKGVVHCLKQIMIKGESVSKIAFQCMQQISLRYKILFDH